MLCWLSHTNAFCEEPGEPLLPSKSKMHVALRYTTVRGNVDVHNASATMVLLPKALVALLGSTVPVQQDVLPLLCHSMASLTITGH